MYALHARCAGMGDFRSSDIAGLGEQYHVDVASFL
jgi:hypothetical protein